MITFLNDLVEAEFNKAVQHMKIIDHKKYFLLVEKLFWKSLQGYEIEIQFVNHKSNFQESCSEFDIKIDRLVGGLIWHGNSWGIHT